MRTVVGMILSVVGFLAASGASGANLIVNGGFERLEADGHPTGYSRAPEYGGRTFPSSSFTSTTNAFRGKRAGLYTCRNAGGFISYHGLRLKPSSWYRFSGWIATDVDPVMASLRNHNPPPGVFVKLMPKLTNRWNGPWPKVTQPILYAGGGLSDWTYYEQCFKSDAVWTNMWIGIYIMKVDGTARFDDLSLEEITEAEAKEWQKRQVTTVGRDGENLLFNGSFEIACNDDMPDYIYSGIGAPWFTDRWTMRRLGSADAPDGSHYLHAPYYMSGDVIKPDTNRAVTVSFFARSDRPGVQLSYVFGSARQVFTLTEKWTRYFHTSRNNRGGRVNLSPVRKTDEFDLDGVMVQYGEALAPFVRKSDEPFWNEYAAHLRRKGEALNRAVADKSFDGPLAAPAPKADGKIDFRFDTVFLGEGLTVRGNVPEASRELVITNAAGTVAWQGTVSAAALASGVTVAKDLAEGTYALQGVPWPFRVVKPAARWCRVDQFAHMAFTEKGPYFPCAFSLSMTERFENEGRFEEIARTGFNTALVWGYGTNKTSRFTGFDPKTARRLLDKLGKLGLDVVSFTPVMKENDYLKMIRDKSIEKVFAWEIRNNTFETILNAKLDFMDALKDHPAVRMWHYYDEIYGYWQRKPQVKRESDMGVTYREARRRNPYQLHWNNSTFAGRLYGGAESTDVTSATIYTIDFVGSAAASVNAGEGLVNVGKKLGGRPGMAGIWLQFYGGDGEVGNRGREPSAAEMEAMMYGCVIKGIRAFWYFSMRPRSNALYFHTGELAREMDALKDVLAFGRDVSFASTHPDVDGKIFEYEGRYYVISCNGVYWGARAKLNLPAACRKGRAKVLFEDREVAFDDWTLQDEWKPLSRHVYVIEPER